MFRQQTVTLFGFACAITLLFTSMADARRYRRFRGGRVVVGAPLVRVQVGPYGTSVRAPFVAVDPGGVQVGARRRFAPVPQYGAPVLVAPQSSAPVYQPTPTPAEDTRPYPTADQLAAMDEAALVATLREMNDRLDARLTRFDTGATWRRYLRIPEDALGSVGGGPSPALQLDVLRKLLTHFDNVASNSEYGNIARLQSFLATHMAFAQLVQRHSGPQVIDPFDSKSAPAKKAADRQEILPTPKSAAKPEATRGERSILRRASRGNSGK